MEDIRKFLCDALSTLTDDKTVFVLNAMESHGVSTLNDMQFIEPLEDLKSVLTTVERRKLKRAIDQFASSSTSSETVCDVSTRENAHYDCDDISVESIDEFSNNWINGFNIPYRKFPSITLSKCENNEKISPGECREVVRIVCSEVLKKTNKPGKNNLEVIARSIVKKYPESFQNRVNSTIVGNGYSSFLNQLRARIENENRGSPKPAKRRAEESIRNFNARVNRDSYGCVRFLPDLSSNENEKTQNEKKDELKKLHDLKNWDIELVAKYMKETYVSQRISIIERNSIEEVIQEWPFLTQSQLFLEHFEELMDINIINKLNIACEQKVPELIGFLKSQRYAGKINFSVSEKPFSWTMMLCNIFEEEESCILLIVEDSSCLNEILQNQNNPVTPHIISFGDPYTLEAICVVVMEHESLSEFVNIKTALCMWFASFYVYNLKYPPGCAATLEFIQRVFLDINPGKGSKQMKQSGRRSDVNAKVLKLVNQLSHFKNMWSL